MSEPEWTPGPWVARNIGEKENCYAVGVPDSEGYGDAVCFVEEGSHATDGSLHADARLIAAAPELYEALEGFRLKPEAIVAAQGDDIILRMPTAAIQKAAAALAKARGE